jgi:hypothetical protein
MASTEGAMWHVIHRKTAQHEKLKEKMYAASRKAAQRHGNRTNYRPNHAAPIPSWFTTIQNRETS